MTREYLSQATLLLLALVALLGVLLFWPVSTADSKESSAILAECAKEVPGKKETCYSKSLEKFALAEGPERAFSVLAEVQKRDRETIGCHFIAHGIGYGTYKRAPEEWQKSFQTISQACSYGAMHGILELRLLDDPESLREERIQSICGATPRGDCNHIVGHLALLLAENDIDAALATCKGLPAGLQQFFCGSGVFMENITALNLIKHGYADESYLDWAGRVEEIERTCLSYAGDEARACWEEIAHALVVKFRNNAGEVFAFCDHAQEKAFSLGCKQHSVGILAAGHQFDLARASVVCEAANEPEFARECSGSLVVSTLATIPGTGEAAARYCARLSDGTNARCFEMLGNSLPPAERTAICASAPETYRARCLSGGVSSPSPIRNDQDF